MVEPTQSGPDQFWVAESHQKVKWSGSGHYWQGRPLCWCDPPVLDRTWGLPVQIVYKQVLQEPVCSCSAVASYLLADALLSISLQAQIDGSADRLSAPSPYTPLPVVPPSSDRDTALATVSKLHTYVHVHTYIHVHTLAYDVMQSRSTWV